MKEYLDKKVDTLIHNEEDELELRKLLIGFSYINLRAECMNSDIFLDECIALAYENLLENGNDTD